MKRHNILSHSNRGRFLPLILILCLFNGGLAGQTVINGPVINDYAEVVNMWTVESSDVDSVEVADASGFEVDDIVMLYQPKGFLIDTVSRIPTGAFGNVGEYALLIVSAKIGNLIVFNNSTQFSNNHPHSRSQLIKVAVYDSAIVENEVTAPAWDSATGTGGVVAMYVKGRLQLNDNIDVSGKGFRGAVPPPTDTYSGGCYLDDPGYQSFYFSLSANDSAGLKGEGAMEWNEMIARGKGRAINGGGGGNAYYAGGGGGGNYFSGGGGYGQSDICGGVVVGDAAGEGGYGLQSNGLYSNFENRIYFGGGGGTGVFDSGGLQSTPGGNGGGIVVIVANEIYSSGTGGIYAKGSDVDQVADGAGGGGGAGGCVVLDANKYSGNITLSAVGGKGGSTVNGGDVTGPGGGGAGGVYWLRYFDFTVLDTVSNYSNHGTTETGGIKHTAENGGATKLITNLEVPLRGFLFNTLPPDDTVCSDVIPDPIAASLPKGGVKPYTYKWIQSPDGISGWVDASGTNDQMNYAFDTELTSTTYFRRVVFDSGSLIDTSTVFTYHVIPKIEGNLIFAPDSIVCNGDQTGLILPSANLSGAEVDSDTLFYWEQNVKNTGWVAAVNINSERDYILPTLYDTTSFRRVVTSAKFCTSVSNEVRILVPDVIVNNTISTKDTLCEGQSPDLVTGSAPAGGDLSNYFYTWEKAIGQDVDYTTTSIDTRDLDYTDSIFMTTHFFRRIVYSAPDSSCVDTSNVQKIEVLGAIGNNLVDEDAVVHNCQFEPLDGDGLTGSQPTQGDGAYDYFWQVSTDQVSWTDVAYDQTLAPAQIDLDVPGDLFVRRLVFSGKDDVCRDTSNMITLDVVESISNNSITPITETYCFGDTVTGTFNGVSATSGTNEIGIEWQYRYVGDEADDWKSAPEPTGGYQWSYKYSEPLDDTIYFRRMAWARKSDTTCVDITADSVVIQVQAGIVNNELISVNGKMLMGAQTDSICTGSDLLVDATTEGEMSGGDESSYAPTWEASETPDFSVATVSGSYDFTSADFRDPVYLRRIIASGACSDTTVDLLVEPIELPTGKLVIGASQPDTVCASEWPVNLTIESLQLDPLAGSYSAYISYISENHSGEESFVFDSDQTPVLPFIVSADSAETYVYTLDSIMDNRLCVSEILDPNQPSVLVFESPEATLTASDTSVCGNEVSLDATNSGGVDWSWFASRVDNAVETSGTDTVTISDSWLHADATLDLWYNDTVIYYYGFVLETDESLNGCSDTAWVHVTHYQPVENFPLVKDEVEVDTVEFYFDQSYNLYEVEPPITVGKGSWSVDNSGAGFMDTAVAVANDFILEQEHVYTWTVENGADCPVWEDELVVIQHDLRQYNGFSPNNDSKNQLFVIPGLYSASYFTFTVFNSWGNKIYEITKDEARVMSVEIDGVPENEHILWDGTLAGEGTFAPEGTYYYTLTFGIEKNGEKTEYEPKQGYIILRR